jgi:NifU-like protein involved in Fe-S cluster formation
MLRLYLDVDGDRIRDASFELSGCVGLQACASCLTSMIKGLTVDEAGRIEVEDIVASLGGLPESKTDCAELARDTLRKAVRDLRRRRSSP